MSEGFSLTKSTLFEIIHSDVNRYGRGEERFLITLLRNLYLHPSLLGVIYYRIGNRLWRFNHNLFILPLIILYRAFYPFIRMYSGLEISMRTDIGPGLCILHFGPTVIHPDVKAGTNLTLLHGVTIGEAKNGTPQIGDNVSVGIGVSIIGKVKIGDNVNIGAGAVVSNDIPSNCTAVGIPARPISKTVHVADEHGETSNLSLPD